MATPSTPGPKPAPFPPRCGITRWCSPTGGSMLSVDAPTVPLVTRFISRRSSSTSACSPGGSPRCRSRYRCGTTVSLHPAVSYTPSAGARLPTRTPLPIRYSMPPRARTAASRLGRRAPRYPRHGAPTPRFWQTAGSMCSVGTTTRGQTRRRSTTPTSTRRAER